MPASVELSSLDRKFLTERIDKVIGMRIFQVQTPHTMASYLSTTQYWFAWYYARFNMQIEFPVSAEVVTQFIFDHAALGGPISGHDCAESRMNDECSTEQSGHKRRFTNQLPADIDDLLNKERLKGKYGYFSFNTLRHHLSVLSFIHRELWFKDNPCKNAKVRELFAIVQSEYTRAGLVAHRLTPLTQEALDLILATCDESAVGKRDRSLLLFAWAAGGRRCSEVVGATIENLRKTGPQSYVYSFTYLHASRQRTKEKNLPGAAAEALNAWLEIRGVGPGPIFQRIFRGDRISNTGLNPGAVRKIVKERCKKAGLPNDYSAHSLRSGFLVDANRRNISLVAAMEISDRQNFLHAASYSSQEYLTNYNPNLFWDSDFLE